MPDRPYGLGSRGQGLLPPGSRPDPYRRLHEPPVRLACPVPLPAKHGEAARSNDRHRQDTGCGPDPESSGPRMARMALTPVIVPGPSEPLNLPAGLFRRHRTRRRWGRTGLLTGHPGSRSGRRTRPAGLPDKLVDAYRSVASAASSTGTIAHATRYSTTPPPPSAANRTITSRTMLASMPLYAASPPHTQAIVRSVLGQVSRPEPDRSGWPAGPSVIPMTSASSRSFTEIIGPIARMR